MPIRAFPLFYGVWPWPAEVYSRFRTDPHFRQGVFERLYDLWIEKSVQVCGVPGGEKVFVCRSGDQVAGMVSVESRGGAGDPSD